MSSSSSLSDRPVFSHPQHFTQNWGSDGWFCNQCEQDVTNVPPMTTRAAMLHERTPAHLRQVEAAQRRNHDQEWREQNHPDKAPLLTAEGLKVRERQWHVDHVRDIVPWWVRGVEAAERGEVLKMEELLNAIPDDPWAAGPADDIGHIWNNEWGGRNNRDEWGFSAHGWGQAAEPQEWKSAKEWSNDQQADWNMNDSASSLRPLRTATPTSAARNKRRKQMIVKRIEQDQGFIGGDVRGRQTMYRFVEEIASREAADEERKRKMHLFLEMSTQDKIRKIQEIIRHLHRGQG